MAILTLNLIPDELKKEIKNRHTNRVVNNNLLAMFVVTTFISIIILTGRIILENRFIATVDNTTQSTGRLVSPLIGDVYKINEMLKTATFIQSDFVPWPNLLAKLSEITPPEVNISQIRIIQANKTLNLSGTAPKRESFLKFKNNLEANNLFTSIKSPVSNILSQENINFNLEITLDLELLQ